ncbi:MAG: lactate racemase domain-containing protein [Rubripirellula sp.]
MTKYPEFFCLRQKFAAHPLEDVSLAVREAMARVDLSIQPGQRVAIAVGSRGIANLTEVVGEVVQRVIAMGGEPLIVPAMGSHGGATSDGQAQVLASFGITAVSMGCPVVSSMDTVLVGTTSGGVDVHFDRTASEADHVIVINRIKPHTRLTGKYESGLIKMLMIGLGKHSGASLYHQVFPDYEYQLDLLAGEIVQMLIDQMPITLGLAIVEDAFEQTSLIEAVAPHELLAREPALLEIAKSRMPRLPFDHVDLLLVDQIGKEISGTGMDTNVIGRKVNDKAAAANELPKVREIYVRSLTEKTAGNGTGIGIAEYCHQHVIDAIDMQKVRVNCVTSAHPSAGAIPLTFPSDRAALDAVVSQAAVDRIADLRWMWIHNTLEISELACSRVYLEAAQKNPDFEILTDPQPLPFDADGNLQRVR